MKASRERLELPREEDRVSDPRRRVISSLDRLVRLLRARVSQEGADAGLSAIQARILAHLAELPPGRATIASLTSEIGLARATASEAVSRLERLGLVAKELHPTDRRQVVLFVTPEGRTVARRLRRWLDPARQLVSERPGEEVRAVEGFLVELIRQLDG